MPTRQRQAWPEASYFRIVLQSPIGVRQHLKNYMTEFVQIWQKCRLGLKDELVRVWWSQSVGPKLKNSKADSFSTQIG